MGGGGYRSIRVILEQGIAQEVQQRHQKMIKRQGLPRQRSNDQKLRVMEELK